MPGHESHVIGVDFSPDGKLVATSDGKGVIKLWDAKAGACVASWEARPRESRP